ncbi:hypothetical protein E0Z10_g2185 [Xylaria hypoxylon]|uniref:NACHT domain-containing protein n=1 Tax=Xylaria hypoxylon TaxID=37992 RepID=A0A4Z0ZAT4_9PEZI|nr:hypothetical protein E0Z10_g2185 [Xylaria hypoxylon]
MEFCEGDADPAFEVLLSKFQQIHKEGLPRLRIHADAAVAIIQKNLSKAYDVKHSPVKAGYKDPEKAVKTLRRRQRERITLGELSAEIERRGKNWAEHCRKWNLQDKETEIEAFRTVGEMFTAMHDLARFRIALTYASDTGRVIDFLRHHFQIVSGPTEKGRQQKEVQRLHKQIEQNGAVSDNKSTVFPGYKATHVIICHKESHPVRQFDDTWEVVIEVQIGTVAMYDWSEIEHDIVYKPQGRVTIPDDAKRILDMINGVTIIGDMMKDHFKNLLDPLETTQAVSSRRRSWQRVDQIHILNERDRGILQDFGGTDPSMDKTRIEETKGSLLRDSYKWVLENEEFLRWNDGGEQPGEQGWSRRLWIRGDPGKGKTMLLCGIITELMESNRGDYDVCYFFCQAADARLNNATSALRGLMHLLVRQQPVLMTYIHDHFDVTGRQMFEGANAWFRAKDTFNRMLGHKGLKKTYIIIDALDECQYQQSELIDWIIGWSQNCTQVKWLVSSRNWPPIVEALGSFEVNTVVSLELNARSVSAALETYIKHKVKVLAERKRYSDFTRAAVQQYLMLKADHTFLWVALVCQHLDKTRLASNELRERLPNLFPRGLDKLYARMLDMISEDDIDSIADQCISILSVMTVSYEPLSLRELMGLIQPSHDHYRDTKVIESRVLYCGSFLALREGTVYFIHQSAQDYLVRDGAKQIIPLGPEEEHHRLYLRSLDALDKILRRNMYNVPSDDFGCSIENIVRPNPDPLASVQHSIAHWIDHFLDSISSTRPERASRDLNEGGRVYMFLSRKYLFWLEALSLQSNVYRGLTAMRKLEELSKVFTHPSQII